MVNFSCPNCKTLFAHTTPGVKVLCPKCGQKISVPAPPPQSKTILGTWEPPTNPPHSSVAVPTAPVPAQPPAASPPYAASPGPCRTVPAEWWNVPTLPALPDPSVEEPIPLDQYAVLKSVPLPPPLPSASNPPPAFPPPVPAAVSLPDEPRRPARWVVPVSIGVLVAVIVGVVIASRNSADNPSNSADIPVSEPPDLVVIFQHSPRRSVAKLVRRGSPIPAGWEGGGGRLMSLEIGEREMQLSATLSNGKEGQTAKLTK